LVRYAVYGLAVGLLFPIIGTVVAWSHTGGRDATALVAMQREQTLLWLIDTVPAFLAAVAGLAGWRHDRLTAVISNLDDTIAHQTSELRAALAAAEAGSTAKSIFVANTSHELRTPLNAVIGMTSLLLDTELTDDQLDFVKTIRDSGDSLLVLINDILDSSKIESGKLDLECHPVDVRGCVEASLDLVARKASEMRIELAYFIDPDATTRVMADETRLRQVLTNLLANAVKFTQRGEVVVSLTSAEVEPGVHELRFAVKDTGIGIPQEAIGRLFQTFSQVDASTTREFGGTGLGLAISRHLCEMMGGRIWVESVVGAGSTFYFTVRVTSVPADAFGDDESSYRQLKGRVALVVDDNETNRLILSHQLRSWGMQTVATSSPAEALTIVRSEQGFAVAVLDFHMPTMDGFQLATELRRLRSSEELPLIMLSSAGSRSDDPDDPKFAAMLSKPVKPLQLGQALLAAVGARPPAVVRDRVDTSHGFDPEMGRQHPLRLLLAEDNVVNQKVLIRMFERLGYRADVAADGNEAVDAVRRQHYDVVFMDVQMPQLDGVEATRRIRNDLPSDEQPHIVAMTAHALSGAREEFLDAGMDDYLSKPVKVDDLVAVLQRCPAAISSMRP
jgi:signal transduction histidine kinase/CheY-like chemotaxis protein